MRRISVATTAGLGRVLGVDEVGLQHCQANIVTQVGNYCESYERNVGQGSILQIDRGLNNLRAKGGLQYAPPIR